MASTAPRERLTRPDGKRWVFDARSGGRKVHIEDTPAGPVVLVTCTHDLEKAAEMASVRWAAKYPGKKLPTGEREWRRRELATWGVSNTVRQVAIGPSTGTETRSFPVVAFRLPSSSAVAS
jgi:hypothetical protein